MKTEKERVVFLDYLRVIACFMVVMVHACEFYYCTETGAVVASEDARLWVALIDGAFRQSVPLFVMVSAFLLFRFPPIQHLFSSGVFQEYLSRFWCGRCFMRLFLWLQAA